MRISQINQVAHIEQRNWRIFTILAVFAIGVAIYWVKIANATPPDPQSYDQAIALAPDGTPNNCRYGVSPLSTAQNNWVSTIGAGFYINFLFSTASNPANGADFYHMIRVSQDKDGNGNYLQTYTTSPRINSSTFNNLIDNNPGHVWVIGNEIDRGPNPGQIEGGQDDTHPDVYVKIYHDLYHYIKGRDATARIMVSALVQVTPNRLQYLDMVWDAYLDRYGVPMPVDLWNMHIYILPEVTAAGQPNGVANIALGTNPVLGKKESGGNSSSCASDAVYCFAEHDSMSVFDQQVRAMRSWMKAHGQQDKPLILTEYSILYPYVVDAGGCFLQDEFGGCFTPSRVNNFMKNSFSYLENTKDASIGYPLDDNRLVQQWLWFAVKTVGAGSASNLINDSETALTLVGQTFQTQTATQPATRNIVIDQVGSVIGYTSGGTATLNVPITIRNSGNRDIATPFTVTFRDASNDIIDQVVVNQVIDGCTTQEVDVTAVWSGLTSGSHTYTVTVDSGGVIPETNESDNVGQGIVIIDPEQIMLPLIQR